MAKTKSTTNPKKNFNWGKSETFTGSRVGIWLRPQDQAVVAALESRWGTKLTPIGTTEIIRRSLAIAEESKA